MTCIEADCEMPVKVKSRGLCARHYDRAHRSRTLAPRPSAIERFLAKIEIDTAGCWLWTGYVAPTGYGKFRFAGGSLAHRFSYSFFVGPVPVGLELDHLCRVRRCSNPEHLEAVTPQENMLRGDQPNAVLFRKDTCARGHERTPETTWVSPDGRKRECRICMRRRALESGDLQPVEAQAS